MKRDNILSLKNKKLISFIQDYSHAKNAATGSKFDSNANVTARNVATLNAELFKEDAICLHYAIFNKYLKMQPDGEALAEQFIEDEDNHLLYVHDATNPLMPYCVAISLYPYLLDGLKPLGGTSGPPKHSDSFIGGLTNLIFLIAGQFAGAVAVPETLPYLDHFLRVDYGDDYIQHLDDQVESFGKRKYTLRKKIEDLFQQFVYCVNQPAAARGYQSPFTNIAYFDRGYFTSIFRDFIFPDGDEPNYESTKELQKMFMKWFNAERLKDVLTFPVETMNLLIDKNTKKFVDEEMADWTSECWASGHSFFLYNSDSADALSSCCFEGSELITIRDKATLKLRTLPISIFCIKHAEDFNKYEIMSYNPETNAIEYSPISGVLVKSNEYPNLIEIEAEDETVLKITPEHIMLVENKNTGEKAEVKAKDLVNNYGKFYLINSKRNHLVIKNVRCIKNSGKVYDIELEKNHWFFANDILTHNCRLKNAIEENTFSYTLGAGGLRTGSKKVITLNLNRITQNWSREGRKEPLEDYIGRIISRVHKYLAAWNAWLVDLYDAGLLTVYSAGYISLEDQYLTVGINGGLEAAEFLGIDPKAGNVEYQQFMDKILKKIKQLNQQDRTATIKYNSEFVPAESAGAKLYAWDKKDGYWVPENRNLYNSYFYPVEDPTYNILEKIKLHGNKFIANLDGGSAAHLNLDAHLTKEQYRRCMDVMAREGCSYATWNIPNTICNECEHIDKRYLHECPECKSKNVDYATRIIGYLKRVSNFSEARQVEASRRFYASGDDDPEC